jgi:hypothetical protein
VVLAGLADFTGAEADLPLAEADLADVEAVFRAGVFLAGEVLAVFDSGLVLEPGFLVDGMV